jgi:hypothetical protein
MSMTVGELAYHMRVTVSAVKQVTHTKWPSVRLTGSALDDALERLKSTLNLSPSGWDLRLLDEYQGAWVSSLRRLYSVPVAFPASVPPSQGIQIRELILRETPQRVLEIGCFIGISSHWIASALKELGSGHLDSVDAFWPKYPNRYHFSYLADPYSCATVAAKEAGFGGCIQFHCSDSVGFKRSLSPGYLYDFIFIDGYHTFHGVTMDFLAYFPHLRKGGVILLHDTNPKHCGCDGPSRLIKDVLADSPNVHVEEIETQPNYGMAVVRKLSDADIEMPVSQSALLGAGLALYRMKNSLQVSIPARVLLREFVKPAITYLRRN